MARSSWHCRPGSRPSAPAVAGLLLSRWRLAWCRRAGAGVRSRGRRRSRPRPRWPGRELGAELALVADGQGEQRLDYALGPVDERRMRMTRYSLARARALMLPPQT